MTWNAKWHDKPNDMKSQMIWNTKWHETSNDMKCQMTWNIKWHEMSNEMKCQMLWNSKCYEMANVMKCQMSWNVKCHEMSNVKCHEMSNITKCWCWIYDPTSRNTRSYTLWSVPSSPRRSLLNRICSLPCVQWCYLTSNDSIFKLAFCCLLFFSLYVGISGQGWKVFL